MAFQLRFVSHSEVGPVRKNNQDSGYASPHLLAVADGMGGAAAGDLASAVAIDTIKVADAPDGDDEKMLDQLSGLVHRANDRIADLIAADHHLEGMGTTVTGAIFDGERFGLVHIGDSRAYLLRDGRLERLTHDHSWVQSLVDDGKISEDEASVHPHRSLLLKVLNGQPANDPDLTTVPVQVGDRVLFCSDGVCGLVADEDIRAALALPSVEEALERLVDEALAEGGIDNITAIVAEVVDGEGAGAVAVLGAAAEREIPSVESLASAQQDDEFSDTLVRQDAIVDTEAATPAAEDEARYNPQPPRRWRFLRLTLGLLAIVLIAGAALGAGYAWTRTQYFVGRTGDQVAIFQGLREGLPGVPLSTVFEIQPLLVSALPPYYADQVNAGIEVASLDAAHQTVAELTAAARRCARPTPTPTGSQTPRTPPPATTPGTSTSPRTPPPSSPRTSPSTSASPSPRPTASVSARPTTSTTPIPPRGC